MCNVRQGIVRRLIAAVVVLLLVGMGVGAQGEAPIKKLFEVPVPDPYTTGKYVKWSPDGRYIAVQVEYRPREGVVGPLWLIYDTVDGELIGDRYVSLYWYADSERLLVYNDDYIITSFNLETHTVDFMLPDMPPDMMALITRNGSGYEKDISGYVTDEIVTHDLYQNLIVYDSHSGEQIFAARDVFNAHYLAPDGTRFAIESSVNDGITVYDTTTWTIIDSTGECFGRSRQEAVLVNQGRSLLLSRCVCEPNCDAKYIWTIGAGMSAPLNKLYYPLWVSPDGAHFLTKIDNDIVLYDTVIGEQIDTIVKGGDSNAYFGSWNDQYVLIVKEALSGERNHAVFDAETGNIVLEIGPGRMSAELAGNKLNVFETEAFFSVYDLSGERDTVTFEHDDPYLTFSPDGRWALTISDEIEDQTRKARLYDLLSEERFTFKAGTADTIIWSPNGRRFVEYGRGSNMISVWEIIAD